jgi:hypothetical protein
MLVGRSDGGMPQPLEARHDPRADPLLAALAVRFAGYWAEGLATVTAKRSPALDAAAPALNAVLSEVRAGVTAAPLQSAASAALQPFNPHPMTATSLGNGIGLSRTEAPFLTSGDAALQDGDVLTLRVGAAAGADDNAIVSAMAFVRGEGADVVWR